MGQRHLIDLRPRRQRTPPRPPPDAHTCSRKKSCALARSLADWLAAPLAAFYWSLCSPRAAPATRAAAPTLVKHTSRRTNEHTTQIKCTLARRQLRRVLLLFNVSLGPKEDESCGRAHFRKLNSAYVIHARSKFTIFKGQIYKQNMLILPCHNISSLVITDSSMHSKICFRI